jgi:hypothetical protein
MSNSPWKGGCHHSPLQWQTRPRAGGNTSLSDELDCLSLTSPFSGKSSLVKMATSSSSAPPRSFQANTLLTKTLPRNPSKATGSCTMLLNSPRTNGTSQLHPDFVPCQSIVLSFSHIVELTLLSCSIRVAGSHLGIRVAPPKIHPPFVCLISTARA